MSGSVLRFAAIAACAAALVCAAVSPSRGGEAERRPGVVVENVSKGARPAGPVTFGMVFARGEIPRDVAVVDIDAQVDVKRRWPDGSVKHAVVIAALGELAARGSRKLSFLPAKAPAGEEPEKAPAREAFGLPDKLGDVAVTISMHKGPTVTARLREALKSEPLRSWLEGDLVRERHYRLAPTGADGKADPDLEIGFNVRYYPAVGAARVTVIVENCHWKSPGNLPYDVAISAGGKEVFAQKDVGRWETGRNPRLKGYVGHPRGARWVKRLWLGRTLDGAHVRYDLKYLNRTGLLPRYDHRVRVPAEAVDKAAERWTASERGPLQRGWLTAYFPTTGGRPEIGPLPAWCVTYLLSQDARALGWVLGQADLAAGCPVHLRDGKTGWIISLDDHPGYSYNDRGTKFKVKPREAAATPWVLPAASHWTVDAAHQGSFAYVPYLVTGDHFYLEEMQFWANHNMVSMNHAYRGGGKGLLQSHQTRGTAWALRNLLHAAALSPDGSGGAKYFEARLKDNLERFNEFLAGKLERKPTPIGTYVLGATHAYTRGWEAKIRGQYFSIPGWQHNFLTWTLAHVADHGYAGAEPMRDYMMKWTTGLASTPKEIPPTASCAYYLFIGERGPEGAARFCRSWKEIADLTWKRPKDVPQAQPPDPKGRCKGEYGAACRGVIIEAMRAARPGASEAMRWVDRNWEGRIAAQWLLDPVGE